jgi:signal transduction histidine kinase
VRWLYDRAKIERDADGVVKYLIGACTNITARKQAEDALRSSEKLAAAGRLAATVAHEINNPLASVVNLLYLVARDPSLSERSRHNLKLADEELDRVSYFARQTLGFYRDNTPATWLDTSQVINELIHIYSYKIRNRNVALETDVSENLHVFASGAEFRQVFSNLLINAVDALPGDGGRVRVRARHVRDWRNRDRSGVRLTVADTGCGIDTANLAKIFEAFYTTKQEIGTGLGLWLCKNIVDKHHGTIRARSRMSGGSHGTVLTVFWPDEAHGASTGASGRASTMHSPAA